MLKVVSDNERSTVQNINAKQVNDWLALHLETVAALLKLLGQRAASLGVMSGSMLSSITENLHFTVSEKIHLKKLLNRWQVLSEGAEPPMSLSEYSSAGAFLEAFNVMIEQLPIRL